MNALQLRKRHGMKQADFWARIGVSQSGGCRYESGRRIPRPVLLLIDIAYGNEKARTRALKALQPKQ